MSLHHCLAVALMDGEAYSSQFTEERPHDSRIQALRRKVTVLADPSLKLEQASLTMKLRDGRTLEGRVGHAIGSPGKPMSGLQVEEKFRRFAALRLRCRSVQFTLAPGIAAFDSTPHDMLNCYPQ